MNSGFRKLIVWQKCHLLVIYIYKITSTFPKNELFGLTSQIRRAIVSVAANIAEGNSWRSEKDSMRYLYIAIGSLAEVEYYLLLAKELTYITKLEYDDAESQRTNVANMLHGLLRSKKNLAND